MIENYVTGRQIAANPAMATLVHRMDNYHTEKDLVQSFGGDPDAAAVVHSLIQQHIVVQEGSELERRERRILASNWGRPTYAYHFYSQYIRFQGLQEESRSLVELARNEPPPAPFKNLSDSGIPLAHVVHRAGGLLRTLAQRRTIRKFSGEAISFRELSTLVRWTWGSSQVCSDPVLGKYLLKTSPSGGARHPTEVYVLAIRVDGLAPGIYHYSVERNELELIRKGKVSRLAMRMCASQPWVQRAAAAFVMTSVVERSHWKYRHGHAYRVLHLDAGHLGQTFQLVATATGLGPFCSAAIDAALIERELALDGIQEFPIYFAAVGRILKQPQC